MYIYNNVLGCDYNKGWNDSFWTEIGLTDLVDDKYERIGIYIYTCIYM